ncbi:capsular polysaccharide synthesis protein [Epibacterium ulvae]|nr:capsular polysaccharide synthesis protein [Epibacterium ulvae]
MRIELLGEYGSVWVDSSVCPTRALEEWIHHLSANGFFAFSLSDPMRPIASWFLAADSGSQLIQTWRQHVRRYWQRSRKLIMDPRDGNPFIVDAMAHVHPSTADQYANFPYYWFHHLFGYLISHDSAFLSDWKKVPRISGMHPQFLRLELEQRPDMLSIERAEKLLGQSPLHKMDWRMRLSQDLEATLLHQINSSKELIMRQSA